MVNIQETILGEEQSSYIFLIIIFSTYIFGEQTLPNPGIQNLDLSAPRGHSKCWSVPRQFITILTEANSCIVVQLSTFSRAPLESNKMMLQIKGM